MTQPNCSQQSNCNSVATTLADDHSSADNYQVDSQSSLSTIDPCCSSSLDNESIFSTIYTQSSYSDHTSDDEFINDESDTIASSLSFIEYPSSSSSQSYNESSFASTLSFDSSNTTTHSDATFFSSSQPPLVCSSFCHLHNSKSSTQH